MAAPEAVPRGSSAVAGSRLRIGTLNVHMWMNANGGYSADGIAALLRAADLDVVGLQEVDRSQYRGRAGETKVQNLKAVCEAAGMPHCAAHVPSFLGNAIFSRWPLENVTTTELRADADHTRSFMSARLSIPGLPTFTFATTHLNHEREPSRLHQLSQVAKVMEASALLAQPLVLVGDFNALSRADYSSSEWTRIASVRARGRWEAPQTDLIPAVCALGFTDLYRVATEGGCGTSKVGGGGGAVGAVTTDAVGCETFTAGAGTDRDVVLSTDALISDSRIHAYLGCGTALPTVLEDTAAELPLTTTDTSSEHATGSAMTTSHSSTGSCFTGTKSTCAYHTRIDYVFANAHWNTAFNLTRYSHVSNKVTDHALVIAEFNVRESPRLA